MASDTSVAMEASSRRVCERLRSAGHKAMWAGGCVRDRLLGRPAKDIDIVTDARPQQVISLFAATKEVGRAFGVVLVRQDQYWFEVATFRRDRDYADGRRPTSVEYADEAADAARRDFTINGMFYDPVEDRVVDLVGGRRDLRERRIRAIGDPEQRFREDHLRMLRAVRFASTLGFEIEPATMEAIRRMAAHLGRIARERIAQELRRILLESPRPGQGVRLLRDSGLLSVVLPEVAALEGLRQRSARHPEGNVFEHTARMLDAMDMRSEALAWAILFHDVGKAATRADETDAEGAPVHFRGHAEVGARIAEAAVRRLRLPNRLVEVVVACVRDHMRYRQIPTMRPARLRRWMAEPAFETGLELHRLDLRVRGAPCPAAERVAEMRRQIAEEGAIPPPKLRGPDLLGLGIPPGPEVGRWLRRVHDHQIENPGLGRDALLEWVRGARRTGTGSPPPAAGRVDRRRGAGRMRQ